MTTAESLKQMSNLVTCDKVPIPHPQGIHAGRSAPCQSPQSYNGELKHIPRGGLPVDHDPVDHPAHYGGADNSYEAIKTCSACKRRKPTEQFPPDRRRKDGRGSKCRDCVEEVRQAYYAKYPEREAQRRAKQARHGASWYERNRDGQAQRMRWNSTKRRYGIGREEYEALLASQEDVCAICGSHDPGRKNGYFAIDHDHDTGLVRGLVCHPCNVGLGMFRDDPEILRKAAWYIDREIQRLAKP